MLDEIKSENVDTKYMRIYQIPEYIGNLCILRYVLSLQLMQNDCYSLGYGKLF